MPDTLLASEMAMFALFRTESTKEYKRMVLFVIHSHIKASTRVSLNRLITEMESKFSMSSDDVNAAVAALELLGAMNKFHVRNARKSDVYQLSLTESDDYVTWEQNVLTEQPELQTLVNLSKPSPTKG